jgi:hypothetical protein
MLFPNPARNKVESKILHSHDLHHGLLQSVQPLHERFPTIVPDQQVVLAAPMPFSLGLQPYLGEPHQHHQHQHHHALPTISSSVHPTQMLYAATALMTPSTISFLKLLLVFIAGGLFFSTAIAGMTACYAMGMDNVRRILEIFGIVLQRVWITFTLGLGATKLALLGESTTTTDKKRWLWKSAWSVFQEQMSETRKTAAQGVQALREDFKLYAAAVGAPGLIPLQHIVDRLMPLSFSTLLESSIKDALSALPRQKTIKKMTLSSFTAGNQPPVLQSARVYDIDNVIAFDYDVHWDSQLEATVQIFTAGGLARFPVQIQNLKFDGVVRVIFTPLCKTPPGYGAVLLSLPTPPKINMDIRVMGGEVTKLPFLRSEITTAIQKAISDQLLWPRRAVVPSMLENNRPLLTQKQLTALEQSDPLLVAEEALKSQQPMLRPVPDTTTDKKKQGNKMFRIFVKEQPVITNENEPIDVGGAKKILANVTTSIPVVHFEKHHDYQKVQKGVLWAWLDRYFEKNENEAEPSMPPIL